MKFTNVQAIHRWRKLEGTVATARNVIEGRGYRPVETEGDADVPREDEVEL